MSAIFGLLNLDGAPAIPEALSILSAAMAHRGPDREGLLIRGALGLGNRALDTTGESVRERQPLENVAGTAALTLDGRIDNREDLLREFRSRGVRLRDDTDADLVLAAYDCWGDAFVSRLLGDFALALWDERRRLLLCARDPLGIRPFYYRQDGPSFRFASELAPLLADPALPRRPNEGMIAEYLAMRINHKEETFYQGVLRLPPAHTLLIDRGSLAVRRYWDVDPDRRIRHRSDEEYGEHFRELFTQAVGCRLRSHRPVGADLSGGLDSSSIVGVAQQLHRDGRRPAPGFETFSLVFPGQSCDESPYIEEVLKLWRPASTLLRTRTPDLEHYANQIRKYLEYPDYPNGGGADPTPEELRRRGIRVCLSGLGGDEWFTGSYLHYADLLRDSRVFDLLEQSRSDRKLHRLGTVILPRYPLVRAGLWPLLPGTLRRAINRCRGPRFPRWLDPDFVKRTGLLDRIAEPSTPRRFRDRTSEHVYRAGTSGRAQHSLELNDRFAAGHGFEYRYPFHDRRLVEFALAVPEAQRWRGDQTKFVLRTAMSRILPPLVRGRLTKAEFSSLSLQLLLSTWASSSLGSLEIARAGWVRQDVIDQMRQSLSPALPHQTQGNVLWAVWVVFASELWYMLLNRAGPKGPIKQG